MNDADSGIEDEPFALATLLCSPADAEYICIVIVVFCGFVSVDDEGFSGLAVLMNPVTVSFVPCVEL